MSRYSPTVLDQSFALDENQPAGFFVGDVQASVARWWDRVTFQLLDDADGLFTINSATGEITATAPLDHETAETYELTVQVTSRLGLTDTATVTVQVGDVNETPQAADAAFAVDENLAAGASVGTVLASDPDDPAEPFGALTYAITAGNTGNLFAIDGATGAITTTAPLDREAAASYELTVTATDGGGLADTATITVQVGDVNEAPQATDAAFAVDENQAAGTPVGTVSAGDPDDPAGPNGTLNYAITAGNTGNFFAIDAATGAITTTAPLDREAAASYELTVTATDGGGLADTATVTIDVGDVNEAPQAADAAFAVDENQAAGTLVGTVQASDPDDPAGPNGTLNYAITVGNAAGLFAIDGSTGAITTTAPLDREAAASYELTVTATDGGGLADQADVTVTVNDLAEGFTLGDLDGNNGFTIRNDLNPASYTGLGQSVSSIGDFNGDGLDDVIVGSQSFDMPGESYVVFGRLEGGPASLGVSDLDGSEGFRIDGVFAGDRAGLAVSGAGDVNGDGFDDIIVGATADSGYDPALPGSSYVVFGSNQPLPADLDLGSLDGSNGFRIAGEKGGDDHGNSVSAAGDINGDGFDDVIVGAPFAGPGTEYYPNAGTGRSYVVFGKANGFDPSIDVADLDGSNGFRLDGVAIGDLSGWTVSGAGDVNGDGFDDLLVGDLSGAAGSFGGVYYGTGRTFVVFGKADGYAPALDLGNLGPDDGFEVVGATTGARLSFSLSEAGDVNGDGFADFIAGAPGAYREPAGTKGEAFVIFGSGEGLPASLDVTTLDGTNGFRIAGVESDDFAGWSVGGGGDVNGDGFDDLIVGATESYSQTKPGKSYVIFGSDQGFAPTLELAAMGPSDGVELPGAESGDRAGSAVGSAGDVNGDGFDDILVAATRADAPGANASGEAYIVFGKDFSGDVVTHQGTAGDDILTGSIADDVMVGGRGDDILVGGAGDDVLTGALGNDVFEFRDGDGADRITDFEGGSGTGDVIDIAGLGFTNLGDVLGQSSQIGGDLVIALDSDDSVTLVGTRSADLAEDDFVFA